MNNYELYRSLHARGETTSTLARKILSSHAQVSLTLNNRPGRGKLTRRELAPLLTARELELVGWGPKGETLRPGDSETLRGAGETGAPGSTGNIVPALSSAATLEGAD